MIREITVKSVLNKKKNRDSWFLDDYTLNPYEGCSFNCQYCYIRGSKYGENMQDGLVAKINGPEVLDRQLAFRVKKQQYGMIALASATDPYIKAEEHYQLTQQFLQLIMKHRFPVMMITKSEGILRDLDLLTSINENAMHSCDLKGSLKQGAYISFSLSTLDGNITTTLEPGAPLPIARLETMRKCKSGGLRVGVNCIPVLPFISDSDSELDRMVEAAKDYGADYVFIGGLTLFGSDPASSKALYFKFLERGFPELVQRYENLYGNFFSPHKRYLNDLNARADKICLKYKIKRTILEP
jgi:DNA repair photolyase